MRPGGRIQVTTAGDESMHHIMRTAGSRLCELSHIFRSALRALLVGLAAALLAVPVVAGSVGYTYDTLGRLKTATYSNGVVITYSYDAAGNRSSQITTGAP